MNPSTQGHTWPPDITGTFTHSPMSPEPSHRHCCVEACHMSYLSQCPGPIQPHICGPHCEDMEPHGHSVTGAHQTRAPTGTAQPRGQTGPRTASQHSSQVQRTMVNMVRATRLSRKRSRRLSPTRKAVGRHVDILSHTGSFSQTCPYVRLAQRKMTSSHAPLVVVMRQGMQVIREMRCGDMEREDNCQSRDMPETWPAWPSYHCEWPSQLV